jgi:hypothetical protein
LPKELSEFAKLVVSERGPRHDRMELTWTDPLPLLNADRGALDSILPFVRMGDGGVIALFWHDAEPCVVHCDSEGESAVIASSFVDFLARLARPTPDFMDRMEIETAIDTSKLIDPGPAPKRVAASLARKFSAWLESHSLSAKPDDSPVGSVLAQKLVAMAQRMLEDGLSKVYKPSSVHWSMEFHIESSGSEWAVTYRDYGKWYPLPSSYELLAIWPELLPLTKKPGARRFELSVWKDGHVYVDGGNQLTIEPDR